MLCTENSSSLNIQRYCQVSKFNVNIDNPLLEQSLYPAVLSVEQVQCDH